MQVFKTPQNPEEAKKRIEALQQIHNKIILDLSCKNRTDKNGRRLSTYEYHEWRQRALHSLTRALTELRFLKSWMNNSFKEAIQEKMEKMDTTEDLLLAAYSIINKHPLIEQVDTERWEDIKSYVEEHLQ